MKTMGMEREGRSRWPAFNDRGISWRQAGAMLALSLLLHASFLGVAALFRFAPVVTETEAAARDSPEIDFVVAEPEPPVEGPSEIAEVEQIHPADYFEAPPEPTPIRSELPRPVAVSRPAPSSAPRLRGNPGATRGTTPARGGNSLTGWSTPKPTYPFEARRLRRQGSGGVRVTTNGSGRVVNAEMLPGIDPLLDAVAVNFARSAWTGPPNATRVVAITFALE
jgi:outer membrane biosynthesis protein TonB